MYVYPYTHTHTQGDTINNFGCGPKGPTDCFVGTTPGEHWARRPGMRRDAQKLKVKVAKGASLPWSPLDEQQGQIAMRSDIQGIQGMQGMQGMQVVDIPDAEVAKMGLLGRGNAGVVVEH